MSGGRFTLRLASGDVVHDVRIQGRGGEVGSDLLHLDPDKQIAANTRSMQAAIRFANAGRRNPVCFEPEPGHALARPGPWRGRLDHEAPTVVVDLRGASIVAVGASRYETESDG